MGNGSLVFYVMDSLQVFYEIFLSCVFIRGCR